MDKGADLSSLRLAVSAGETLPAPVFEAWTRRTGKTILDGIGSTELLHIFITNRTGDAVAGTTGRPVSGYEAKIVDDDMNELPDGAAGRLAVRGPTGCRYLADSRQSNYVRNGWNLTGDTFVRDESGRFSFAGPEIEAALLTHAAVAECGVVGAPDEARGMIVKAYVVVASGISADAALASELQEHVKREIAPYKYPRAIEFVAQLPKTETGKLKRFALRQMARAGAASSGMAAE
jgi:2-aminobenzoate-CoA ligase